MPTCARTDRFWAPLVHRATLPCFCRWGLTWPRLLTSGLHLLVWSMPIAPFPNRKRYIYNKHPTIMSILSIRSHQHKTGTSLTICYSLQLQCVLWILCCLMPSDWPNVHPMNLQSLNQLDEKVLGWNHGMEGEKEITKQSELQIALNPFVAD